MSSPRHNFGPRKRKTTVTVPERVGPHVKLVFTEMRRLNITYDEVEEGSGVLRPTIKAWRHKNRPSLESLEAVLGLLGYDFVPIPRANVLPPAVEAALRPLAEKMGMEMPIATQALIEVVTGIHANLKPVPSPSAAVVQFPARRKAKELHPDMKSMFEEAGCAA